MRFVDTNVLLYAVSQDAGEQPKAELARSILANRDLALSSQVLQEFYVQATRVSRRNPLSHKQATDLVTSFTRFRTQGITAELVILAMKARERFQISYWDAAIVEAARMLGCRELLSEDLNHEQDYGGVVVINPFRGAIRSTGG